MRKLVYNKLKIATLAIFVVGFAFNSFGQNNYVPLRSNGVIPDDFIKATDEKYKEDVEKIESQKIKRKDRRLHKDFALGSNLGVDAMLLNGSVMYNDSISQYITQVAKEILKDDEELFNEFRFYTLKDDVANAFTTANGIVLFTTGLVARLENEAQLAFILCHEMSHYILKHGENNYVKKQKVIRGDKGYRNLSLLEKVHMLFGYSKKAEYEADETGLELFLKTGYDKRDAVTAFDVLKRADEPLADVGFDFRRLEGAYYILPENLFIDELKEKKDRGSDTFSTHPAAEKRQYNLEDLLETEELKGKEYIVSEKRFKEVKYMAQMEFLLVSVYSGNYVSAIHNANYLLTLYPENIFVKNVLTYCMYSLSKASTKSDKSDYILSGDFGNLSETNYFFKKIRKKDLIVLTLKEAYLNYSSNTSNEFAKSIFVDQVKELMKVDFTYRDFDVDAPVDARAAYIKDSISIEEKYGDKLTKAQKKRKLNRIKKKKKKKYINYAFYDFIHDEKDTLFKEMFKTAAREYKKEVVKSEREQFKTLESTSSSSLNNGVAVGMDSIMVLSPGMRSVSYRNNRKSKAEDKLKSNMEEQELEEMLKSNANKLGMTLDVLEERGEDGLTTESFIARTMLLECLKERVTTSFRKQITFSDQYKSIIYDEFGTYNVGLLNVSNIVYPGAVNPNNVLLIFVYGIGLPFVINDALPDYYTHMNFLVINVEDGTIPCIFNYSFNTKYKSKLVDSHIYHILHQLNAQKKDEK